MKAAMVRAYVESLLEQLTGSDKVVPDDDGDYPVRFRSSLYYVRLVGDVDPVVQVFAIAVKDVDGSPGLFEKLNDVNSRIRFARTFWVDRQVLVEADLVGQTLDPEEFGSACDAVATITDHVAPQIAEEFGGQTFFADETEPDRNVTADEEPVAATGLYL